MDLITITRNPDGTYTIGVCDSTTTVSTDEKGDIPLGGVLLLLVELLRCCGEEAEQPQPTPAAPPQPARAPK